METTKRFIQNRWGCVVCAAGFIAFCGMLSPINSYGRLFTAIQKDLNTTTIQTGWVGSVAWSTSFLVGPIAVVIERFIGHRLTTVIGCLLSSCCYLVTSFVVSYAGLLVFLGIICGLSIGVSVHAVICVIFKTFTHSNQTRATGMSLAGASLGTIGVSLAYEKMVPVLGWRKTLQITFAYSALLSVPVSFLITPRDETSRWSKPPETDTTAKKELKKEDAEKRKENSISSISGRVDDVKVEQPTREPNGPEPKEKHWSHLIVLWKAWLIYFAIGFPAMSWSTYWVNSVSYFESISASADDIFLYVTIMTVADLMGKVAVIIIPSRFLEAVKTLTVTNILAVIVTLLFVLCPIKPVLAACCAFIGVGRAWFNIFPYKVAVDILQVTDSDQGVTLCMVALGTGFGIGTIPASAIHDATGSYTLAFIINAVFYFIGATFLIILQSSIPRCRRNRKASGQSVCKIRRTSSHDVQCIDNVHMEMES